MAILRRTLYLDALVSAVAGIFLVAAPGVLFVTVLGQPEPSDPAPLRLLGVATFTLALVMVLIAHRVQDLWWWCWAFVLLEAGSAAVSTLHAAFGVPEGAAAWPWWAVGLGSWAFAFAFLWGIARAGTEAPPP
jgi:formate/nitrite transporter FocA (FNT family)